MGETTYPKREPKRASIEDMIRAYHVVLRDLPAADAAKLHGIRNPEDLALLSALAEDVRRLNHPDADFKGARAALREGGASAQFVIDLFAINNPRERRQLHLEEVIFRTMSQHFNGIVQARELWFPEPLVEKSTDQRVGESAIYAAMYSIADNVSFQRVVEQFNITDERDLALLQPVADEAARWRSRAGIEPLIAAQKRMRQRQIPPEMAAEELGITHRQDLAVLRKLAESQA